MRKERKAAQRPQFPLEPLESRQLCSAVVHDGGGTQLLTSSMIQSGQTYQNYLVRSTLKVANVSNVAITQCDVGGFSGDGIDLNTITNVSVTNNNFHDLSSGTGIGALPTTIINSHFDGNTFAAAPHGVHEPIHLFFGYSSQSANDTVSGNQILSYGRIGIELQQVVHGLTVTNNYITGRAPLQPNQGGDMAISCATGGTVPGAADTTGVEIAHNTIIGTNPLAFGYVSAIESMGSGNNIHDNYIQYFGNAVIYGLTVESGNVPWHITNNTLVGVNNLAADEGFGNGSVPVSSGNASYAANDPKAPAPPPWSATGNPSGTPTPSVSVATPTGLAGTAASDGIHLSWQPVSGASYVLSWTATSGTQSQTVSLPAGTTSFVDASVPAQWAVDYTITATVSGAQSSPSNSVHVQALPAVGSSTTPPVTTSTALAAPAGLTATAAADGIHLSWGPTSGASYVLSWKATHGTQTQTFNLPAGTSSYVDSSVPSQWEVDYTIKAVINGTSSNPSASVHVQALNLPAGTVSSPGPVTAPVAVGTDPIVTLPMVGTDPVTTPTVVGDLVSGWTGADIGSVVSAGSWSQSNGVMSVNSPTADTAQSPVATHFVYQTLGQKGSITVQLSGVAGTAGLKLASDLQSDASTASLVTDANGNITFTTQGATSASSSSGSVEAKGDAWLKLVRNGSHVIGFASSDGIAWQRIGSANLNLPNSVDVGMAVTSQTNGAIGSAQFSHVALNGTATQTVSAPKVTPDRVVAAVTGTGDGLKAQMFSNVHRSGKAMTTTSPVVDFNWGQGTPDSSISSTPYSVRWTGLVQPQYSDVYTLSVNSDSGVKLFVNGNPVIHNWQKTGAGTETGTVAMEAGKKYHLRLVYGEKGNSDSNVSLGWSSEHQASEIIPQSQLYTEAA